MQMTVISLNEDGTSELTCINLDDVDYIELENRRIVYYVQTKKYYHMVTLSDFYEHLAGYEFDMLDKTNVVNLNKVKKLDEQQGKVYFEAEPTNSSKYATVAFIKQKLFRNDILRRINNNNNTSMEIKMVQGHNGKVVESMTTE